MRGASKKEKHVKSLNNQKKTRGRRGFEPTPIGSSRSPEGWKLPRKLSEIDAPSHPRQLRYRLRYVPRSTPYATWREYEVQTLDLLGTLAERSFIPRAPLACISLASARLLPGWAAAGGPNPRKQQPLPES